jgi:hypothetical protein
MYRFYAKVLRSEYGRKAARSRIDPVVVVRLSLRRSLRRTTGATDSGTPAAGYRGIAMLDLTFWVA